MTSTASQDLTTARFGQLDQEPITDGTGRAVLARIQPKRRAIVDGPERRQAQRAATTIPIRLTIANATKALGGRAIDISRSGVLVALASAPRVGALADIELQLADQKLKLHARAEIVRVVRHEMEWHVGVRFLVIAADVRELLEAIVESHPLIL